MTPSWKGGVLQVADLLVDLIGIEPMTCVGSTQTLAFRSGHLCSSLLHKCRPNTLTNETAEPIVATLSRQLVTM